MITCKTCKKFAKMDMVIKNGLDQVLLIGSCKHCGYTKQPELPEKYDGSIIEKLSSPIDFEYWEELGLESNY